MVTSPFNHTIFINNITPSDWNNGTAEANYLDEDIRAFLAWYTQTANSTNPDLVSPYNGGSYTPISPYNHTVFINNITPSDWNNGTLSGNFQDGDIRAFIAWYTQTSNSANPDLISPYYEIPAEPEPEPEPIPEPEPEPEPERAPDLSITMNSESGDIVLTGNDHDDLSELTLKIVQLTFDDSVSENIYYNRYDWITPSNTEWYLDLSGNFGDGTIIRDDVNYLANNLKKANIINLKNNSIVLMNIGTTDNFDDLRPQLDTTSILTQIVAYNANYTSNDDKNITFRTIPFQGEKGLIIENS